jgi:hypothetical protein
MANIGGTRIAAPITPGGDDANTYPTHYDIYGAGGLMVVTALSALTAIPLGRQKVGMLIFSQDTSQYYTVTSTGAALTGICPILSLSAYTTYTTINTLTSQLITNTILTNALTAYTSNATTNVLTAQLITNPVLTNALTAYTSNVTTNTLTSQLVTNPVLSYTLTAYPTNNILNNSLSSSNNWQNTYTTVTAGSAIWGIGGVTNIPIVANSTVGGIASGTSFSVNTPLSAIIQRLLVAAVPYNYTYPTLTVNTSSYNNLSYEIGTSITPIITSIWTQYDAGSATSYTILTSTDNSNYYTLTSISLNVTYNINAVSAFKIAPFNLLNVLYFEDVINYSKGAQGYDNYGQASGTSLPASSKTSTNNITFTPYRNIFSTSDTSSIALSSSTNIRALTPTQALLTNQIVNINTHTGDTRFAFAYPAEYAITSINDPVNGTLVNTTNANTIVNYFTVTTVSVNGANSLAPNNYRVYKYKNTTPTNTYSINSSYNISVQYPDTSTPQNSVYTSPNTITAEAGSPTNTTLYYTYTQHGGGNQTNLVILSSTTNSGPWTTINTNNSPTNSFSYTTSNFNVSNSTSTKTLYFEVSANYTAGVQLYTNYNDSYGSPVAAGYIVTSTTSVDTIGQFRVYAGTTTQALPTDVQVRTASTGTNVVDTLQNTRPFSNTNGNNGSKYTFTFDSTFRYAYFAYPTFMETTTPTFTFNGFGGNYFTRSTITSFTNQYGAATDYYIWVSNNAYNNSTADVTFTG